MIANTIAALNNDIRQYAFFEFSILKFQDGNLTIAGSEDLIYFHQIEIEFLNVHTIVCNRSFKIDTSKAAVSVIANTEEAIAVNKKYGVTTGNNIFKFISEDNQEFYIISKAIAYKNAVVKYSK